MALKPQPPSHPNVNQGSMMQNGPVAAVTKRKHRVASTGSNTESLVQQITQHRSPQPQRAGTAASEQLSPCSEALRKLASHNVG